jgi:Arylsulfatase A and related enzymes
MAAISRRSFLFSAAAAAVPPGLQAQAKDSKNVLFIASDDLNNCLSCYGHPIVKTPNIDRIAKSGVRFDRAYCQFPLCSPSRSSIMTGLAPDTTTVYDLQKHFRSAIPDVVTLGQLFQRNGYFSARVGKIFHYGVPSQIGTDGLDDKPSWNVALNPNGVDHTKEERLLTNYTPQRGLGSSISFYASQAKDDEHTDGIVANEVVRLLEERRKDRFFIAAGFYRPHVPWIAPSKYFDLYPLEKIALVPFDESEMRIAPELAYFTRPANWGMSEKQRRDAIRAYYASIAFLDAQVGKLLDALDRLKLTDSTTIVFWSDHGYQLGEHGQWMKQTLFEASARVPLLIGGAGVQARGRASGRTVELLDLYPTLADLCGLAGAPANLHGQSLKPLLKKPDAPWSKPAITQVARRNRGQMSMGYSIRNERYRYTFWNEGESGEELYDYRTDPRELKNRAGDQSLASVKSQLRSQLVAILERRGKRRA